MLEAHDEKDYRHLAVMAALSFARECDAYENQLDDETPAPLAILLENQRAFLTYLEPRVGDRAFAKVVDRPAC
jgi:hypothetical protein